jgi:prephenate dehydrogenase
LAVQVDNLVSLLPEVLNRVANQIVMDVGSTKSRLMKVIDDHPNRGNFVATHPMAGTEYSGPEAAIPNLFEGKCAVLCDVEKSNEQALQTVKTVYKSLNMSTVQLDAKAHDIHCAYVSHISHISSFALALTVLEKEKDEKKIFELAGGGFESTVRLAKSSPEMWIPIFDQNRDNVLDVLDEHINTLASFRSLLIKKDFKTFFELIQKANSIKKIIH